MDGVRAHQLHLVLSQTEQQLPAEVRAKRDALEIAIARLRESKAQMPEEEYYSKLENLLIELEKAYGEQL